MPAARTEIECHTALRGITALCVVVCHCQIVFNHEVGYFPLSRFFLFSFLGVDLFFILSGYILAYLYADDFFDQKDFWRTTRSFVWRRTTRIYPNYFFWLLVAVAVSLLLERLRTGTVDFSRDDAVSLGMHVAMVQFLFYAPTIWNVALWSIATEMIAYCLFGTLVLLRRSWPGWSDLSLLFASGIGVLVVVISNGSMDAIFYGLPVVRCLAGFTTGLVLAANRSRLEDYSTSTITRLQLASAGLSGAATLAGQEVVAIASFAALVYVTGENRGWLWSVLRLRPFQFLGLISYSVYLAHISVMELWTHFGGAVEATLKLPVRSDWLLFSLMVVAITIVTAAIAFRYVEGPLRRWFKSGPKGPLVPPPLQLRPAHP